MILAIAAVAAVLGAWMISSGWLPFGDEPDPPAGFARESGSAQLDVEARLAAMPSESRLAADHRFLTAEPHVAGSLRDHRLAEWTRDRWRDAGLEEVEIVEHEVLLSHPKEVTVELVAPRAWRASMKEDPVPGDAATEMDVGIPYHAYSASGAATADLVYASSGNPADYDWLASQGIDVEGKVVLVRYSVPYSYRGFKALTAERRGAAGLLIYSDPADDGFVKGETYPKGPWGPESHIQRGGIVYDFMVPGDPLTPGWASTPGARRIARDAADSLPRIMSAPLSYKDARVLLEALGGPEAPKAWQGGLPITYRVGPGPARVHMRVTMADPVQPIWTVTGRIRGSERPDEVVLVGNHRDAWVFGGVDPSSGSAAMMELARVLGALVKDGIRPKRSILFASWDAEEFTLTSSTEWGEQHESWLRDRAIAYLNVDSASSGPNFSAAAVPSLNRLVTESADAVTDPGTGRSIGARSRERRAVERGTLPTGGGESMVNNRLGSGSDYTVFLNFLGVPVVDMSFDGPYGVYHSMYDNHRWVAEIGDPGFRYHAAMTKIWAVMALRLANADVLPLDYRPYASIIQTFLEEQEKRWATVPAARQADSAGRAPVPPQAVFEPARSAAARFADAARQASERAARLLAGTPADGEAVDRLNRSLMAVERAFLDPDGLPGRPWYRHQIYAPKYTYAPEVLPAVAEAIDRADRAGVVAAVERLRAALDRARQALLM